MSKWHHPTKIRKKERLNCERKVKHINEISARSAMKEVADNGMLHAGAVSYECQRCGYWHWGRLPQ